MTVNVVESFHDLVREARKMDKTKGSHGSKGSVNKDAKQTAKKEGNASRVQSRGDLPLKENNPVRVRPNNAIARPAAEETTQIRHRILEAVKSGLLDLASQKLSSAGFDSLRFPRDTSNITAVILGGNDLTEVPSSLFTRFPNLVHLDLSRNQLASIPPSLCDFPDLEVLDLSHNPALAGRRLPSAFHPLLHRVAVFADDDVIPADDDDDEPSDDEEEEDGNYALHYKTVRHAIEMLRADIMGTRRRGSEEEAESADLALTHFFALLQTRLGSTAAARFLTPHFRRKLAIRDAGFVQFVIRRYAKDGREAARLEEARRWGARDAEEEGEQFAVDHQKVLEKRRNEKTARKWERDMKERWVFERKEKRRQVKELRRAAVVAGEV
ncbi:hypothetical protein HK101_009687 [Irineochytrium annulatum]|nr:hypothetical protein HK101_009687 [Irineochytrium annulatum]